MINIVCFTFFFCIVLFLIFILKTYMLQAFLKSTSSNDQSLPRKLSISWHVPFSGHDDVHFLNDVANDAESTQKLIIMSYSLVCIVNQLGKLINRILGLRLLISSLPGVASRTHVELLGKPCDVNKHFRSLAW